MRCYPRVAALWEFTISSSLLANTPIMGAIGWIWAWLMLLGGVRAHFAHALPAELVWAMVASGLVALPLLWDRDNGVFGPFAPAGIVRAGISLLLLAVAGISHPSAVTSLISA